MEQKKIVFEPYSLLRDLLRNFWIVILAALMGFMGTYIVQHSIYKPEYSSSVTLAVTMPAEDYTSFSSLSVENRMAEILTNVFQQPSMKQRAAEYLGMSGFKGSISGNVISGTNIFVLRVTSPNPETSYRELQAVLTVYPEITDQVFTDTVIYTIKPAAMAKSPSNSISSGTQKKIVLLCAAAAVVVICLFSLLRDTVKTESAFRSKVDAELFEIVTHEKKKPGSLKALFKKNRTGLLIHENVGVSLKFTENYYKMAAKLEHIRSQHGEKVFAVTSVAENEGKSTVAANIALALAGKGHRVVLVDFDLMKPAMQKLFGVAAPDGQTLIDYLRGSVALEDYAPVPYKKTHLSLAFSNKAAGREQLFESDAARLLLDRLRGEYGFVIIDTAPLSADAAVTNVVGMVDKTYLVVRTDGVPVSAVNDAALTIRNVGGSLGGCILNDVYPEMSLMGNTGYDETGYYSGVGYGKGYKKYGGGYDKYGHYKSYGGYSRYAHYAGYDRYERYAATGPDLGSDETDGGDWLNKSTSPEGTEAEVKPIERD